MEIEIKNYRCFPDSRPARFTLEPGFTAFVGPNNSGKSSLLRFFYDFRRLFVLLSDSSHVKTALGPKLGQVDLGDFPPPVLDQAAPFSRNNDRSLSLDIALSGKKRDGVAGAEHLTVIVDREPRAAQLEVHVGGQQLRDVAEVSEDYAHVNGNRIANLREMLDAMRTLQNTLYIPAFRNAINMQGQQPYFDLRVGQQFISRWNELKTGGTSKDSEAIVRLTEEIKHIFDFDSLEINAPDDKSTLQLIVNGRSFRLEEVGAGLAQFIMVLAQAMISKPSYILIDEPESNLHPALQIDFLTTLASYASEGILFNTHNIGLARAVADHIYTVQRVDEGESEIRPFEATLNYAELLGALSYSGYRALGFEKVLLVEGPTEVRTIQQFLRHLGLDHKVVLVPMGGSSLINAKSGYELGELARISDRTFALIDSERSTEDERPSPDREGFLDACEKLGIECHMLDRRAIENYFTDGAVKAAMGLNYSALDPYQLLKEKQPQWAKSQGWRIARRMSWKDIEQTDLGAFLQKLKND